MLRGLLVTLRALFRRRRAERELDDELRYHLDRAVGQLRDRGAAADDATRAARLEFGSVEAVKEECRESWGTAFVDSWLSDFRHAVRQLRKSPIFSLTAILSIAIAIGSNTAVFSLLDRVVFRPLPVEDPQRLVILTYSQNGRTSSFSYPAFQELAARQNVLEGAFASCDFPLKDMVVRGAGGSSTAAGRLVSGSYFDVLRVRPAFGRLLNVNDDRAGVPGVAVISYRFWEREFRRDPAALGQALRVNQAQLTIIGITPQEFFGETPGSAPDLYIPMSLQPQVAPNLLQARFATWLTVMGRLRDGITREQAAAALTSIAGDIAHLSAITGSAHPAIGVQDGARGLEQLRRDFSKPLWLLMAMVGLVLLVACFNVANLMLARGSARARDSAVRLALGAGRMRLVQQFVAESILVAIAGATLGIALANWSGRALVQLASQGRDLSVPVELDSRMLTFAALATVGCAVLFGFLPAWTVSGLEAPGALAGHGRTSTAPKALLARTRGLIALQIAVTMVLVSCAGLLTRTLFSLRHQDFGIRPANLLMVKLPLELTPGAMSRSELLRGELLDRLRVTPGVIRAAASCCGPFDDIAHSGPAAGEGMPGAESETTRIVHVSPDYLETAGMTLIAGRTLNAADRTGAPPVAVLSQAAAARIFGGAQAVGKRISLGKQFDASKSMEVVGLVKDARFAGPREEFRVLVFVPMAQQPAPVTSFFIRTAGSAASIAPSVRKLVESMAPGIRVGSIEDCNVIIEQKLHSERMLSWLSTLFAAQTLALAAIGIYGMTAFGVAGRRREIGIRMAFGARRSGVMSLILGGAAVPLAIGTALGAAGAVCAGYAMRTILFGVAAFDPTTLLAAVCIISAAAFAAASWPAWAAANSSAMNVLREE